MSDQVINPHTRKGTLQFPGVEFQSNKLAISGDLEGDSLRELTRFLVSANNSSIWWISDLCVWLKANKGQEFAYEVADQTDDPLRVRDAMIVAERLPIRFRLSFAHHRESFIECNRDPATAILWLQKAEMNNWGVAEMRREIRHANRVGIEPVGKGKSGSSVTITNDLVQLRWKMNRILEDNPIGEWNIDQVIALKSDLEPILRLAAMIDERLTELSQEN